MAEELWYRGTAIGVPPARGEIHDLGDGTYYTDKLDVAYGFAGMRSKSDEQVPYVMWGKVDPTTKGKVLDLTTGEMKQAWDRFGERRLTPDSPTFHEMRRMGGGSAGKMFNNFLAEQRLNLNDYDIVIGPNYIQGGRQMVVRTSAAADKIEPLFVVGAPPKSLPSTNAPLQPLTTELTYSAKGRANATAMVVAFMVVDAAANYLNSRFQEAEVQKQTASDMQSIRDWQKEHPTDGALIVITFKRTVINSEFMKNKVMIQPGDAFEYSSLYFAETPQEAAQQMAKEREMTEVDVPDGPYKTVHSKQGIWIPPRLIRENSIVASPVGKWKVKIGDWNGWFAFRTDGSCAWTEASGGPEHKGTWKSAGGELQWTYSDDTKGWERVFHAKLPLTAKVNGEATIKGVNHGYYEMMKT
jgi:hypothetical protein